MAITKQQILPLWGRHPARKIPFSELYENLQQHVAQNNIKCNIKGDLALFNYTRKAQIESLWDTFTLISRGLILDPSQQKVIATPFPKFFNLGEVETWESDKTIGEIIVATKYDGSLGILYHYKNKWYLATRGSFDSEQAIWGQQWVEKYLNTDILTIGDTYLFEIIYKNNKIVVNYDFEGIVLLGAYQNNGEEYNYHQLKHIAYQLNIRLAEAYPFYSIKKLAEQADQLDANSEGWVIRFANGHRLKIKGKVYCEMHKLISQITPLTIWEMMFMQKDLNKIKQDLPEEHWIDFDHIVNLLNNSFNNYVIEIKNNKEKYQMFSDKEIGLALQNNQWPNGNPITLIEKTFLFTTRKHDFFKYVYEGGHKFRRMVFQQFRPTGNVLFGYTPSNAITRFQEEN